MPCWLSQFSLVYFQIPKKLQMFCLHSAGIHLWIHHRWMPANQILITSDSKKLWQSTLLYHYCGSSRFFFESDVSLNLLSNCISSHLSNKQGVSLFVYWFFRLFPSCSMLIYYLHLDEINILSSGLLIPKLLYFWHCRIYVSQNTVSAQSKDTQ